MPDLTQFPIGASATLAQLEGDVHAVMHELRSAEPISFLPAINAWLVTRHDDAITVMRDDKTYTVDHPGFSTAQVVGPSMLSLDGAEHQQHRRPFEVPFRKRAVQSRFNQKVAEHIGGLLTGFAQDGKAELRRDFAGPVAVKTMMTALGLEKIPVDAVLGWYDTIVEAVTRVTAGEPVSAEGRVAFAALHESLLPALRRDPDASLLAAAAGVANGLGDEQIVSNAAVLLFGGIETTEGMIANAFYHLLQNREQLEKVKGDWSLLPKAVEESLRLEPAAGVIDRYATVDVVLRGVQIQAGDLVRVSLSGANRDPEVFEEPDAFRLGQRLEIKPSPDLCPRPSCLPWPPPRPSRSATSPPTSLYPTP